MKRLPLYAPPATYGECIAGTPTTGTRAERMTGRKQCGAYDCRYNLSITLDDDMPGRRYDGRAPEWSFDGEAASAFAPSCALDVAATGPKNCSELSALSGRHRRRWQQEVRAAVLRWFAACERRGIDTSILRQQIGAILESER